MAVLYSATQIELLPDRACRRASVPREDRARTCWTTPRPRASSPRGSPTRRAPAARSARCSSTSGSSRASATTCAATSCSPRDSPHDRRAGSLDARERGRLARAIRAVARRSYESEGLTNTPAHVRRLTAAGVEARRAAVSRLCPRRPAVLGLRHADPPCRGQRAGTFLLRPLSTHVTPAAAPLKRRAPGDSPCRTARPPRPPCRACPPPEPSPPAMPPCATPPRRSPRRSSPEDCALQSMPDASPSSGTSRTRPGSSRPSCSRRTAGLSCRSTRVPRASSTRTTTASGDGIRAPQRGLLSRPYARTRCARIARHVDARDGATLLARRRGRARARRRWSSSGCTTSSSTRS